jgi:hypothetical protein
LFFLFVLTPTAPNRPMSHHFCHTSSRLPNDGAPTMGATNRAALAVSLALNPLAWLRKGASVRRNILRRNID